MPELDLAREHLRTGLRLPRKDEIAYFLVGPQETVGIRVPELLRSPFLQLLGCLPKSGIQIMYPLAFLHGSIAKNEPQPVRFGIVFEHNFASWFKYQNDEPALIRVFFWSSTYEDAMDALKDLSGRVLVLPATEQIRARFVSQGVDASRLISNCDALVEAIRRAVAEELGTTETVLLERRKEVDALVGKLHSERFSRTVLPFAPAYVNLFHFQQIFGQFGARYWKTSAKNDRTRRPAYLVSSFKAVANAIARVSEFDVGGEQRHARLPAAILAFPSISPALKRELKGKLGEAPHELRDLFKAVTVVRLAEQDTRTYQNSFEHEKKNIPPLALQIGATETASYTHFFDAIGYLHGSFHCAPYLRCPLKGDSLAKLHARFSPASFAANATDASKHRLIGKFSQQLSDAVAPEIRTMLRDYPGGYVALSDLPVEWMSCGGVPMCFLHDVCRIPETVASNLMAQFARNRHSRYQITSETPKRTLVVCGAPAGDPIVRHFEILSEMWQKAGVPWRWLHCKSLDQLLREVNDFRPELLVFDTHGRFDRNKEGTELQIGNERLTGKTVVESFPQIPLVMLSTCWGAPLYGCPNTIAHAFFEAGSISVITSMLPLNVFKGSILYTRLLNNLAYASSTGVHHHWSSFVSHNLRTAYFDDLKARVMKRFPTSDVSEEAYIARRTKWQFDTMLHSTRAGAFKGAAEALCDCFAPDMRKRISNLLRLNDYIPEFMYYSVMGRADLVQFKVWNDTRHEASPFANTLADLVKQP